MRPVSTGVLAGLLLLAAPAVPAFADSVPILMSGAFSFYDVSYSNVNRLEFNYTNESEHPDYTASVVWNEGFDYRYASAYQWAYLRAFTPGQIDWSSAIVNIMEFSNGNPVFVTSFNNLGPGSCVSQYQSAANVLLNACASPDGSSVIYDRRAGNATNYQSSFSSYQYTEYWNNGIVFTYSSDVNNAPQQTTLSQYGQRVPVGSQYGFDLQIHDGSTTYGGSAQFALTPSGWTNGSPWTCDSSGNSCSEAFQVNSQNWGWGVSSVNTVPEPASLQLLIVAIFTAAVCSF